MARRNLIITGGVFHRFTEAAAELSAALSEVGFVSEATDDFDLALERLRGGDCALLTVYALRWRMLNDEKYEPHRAEWALEMTPQRRAAIEDFVGAGGGLLGMHTASICFDDWPKWRSILGGAWVWGTSHHPPLGAVSVRPRAEGGALTQGLTPFVLHDEAYMSLAVEQGVTPLLEAAVDGSSEWHCAAWKHQFGRGRVICDLLGHEEASIMEPTHRAFLQRAALWAARPEAEMRAL